MTLDDAKNVFTDNTKVKFGNDSRVYDNPTSYEKIKNSGAVFIPLTAYRAAGTKTLVQWGTMVIILPPHTGDQECYILSSRKQASQIQRQVDGDRVV